MGVFITPFLSIKLNPSKHLPSVTVNYNWINASPYAVEKDITSKLESGFSTIKGLKNIQSKSSKSSGFITLEFDEYTDLDVSRFETATIIRQLYNQLPQQSSYPTISTNRPDEAESTAFLSYSINANQAPFYIYEVVTTQLTPIIGSIEGVDKVEVYGAKPREYQISYNSELLKTLGIDKKDLAIALQQTFSSQSLGEINHNGNYITASIKNQSDWVDWHIPIKKVKDRLVYLDEISTIKKREQEAQSYYRVNGKNAITINLYASKHTNTIALAKEVDQTIQNLKNQLPNNYDITKSYDSTEYLKAELNKIYERTIYTVIILLSFILIISKSFRYLVIIIISLMVNIAIAFFLYYLFQVEIQLYSLAGITISLGLIVDNSIVMIDHMRHQQDKSVILPILASTLTTIGALSIIYFLEDNYKVNLIDFAFVIIINLGVSLFVALFLIPALLQSFKLPIKKEKRRSLALKEKFYNFYEKFINLQLRYKNLFIILIIVVFGLPFFMLPQTVESDTWYQSMYNNTLGNEWYRKHVRPNIDRYLGGSFRLFNYYVFENANYSKNEETKLFVTASMEKGATVHQMNEFFLQMENYLQLFDGIKQYNTHIFNGDYGRMEITFHQKDGSEVFPFVLKSRLVGKAMDFGGIDLNVFGVGNVFTSGNNAIGEPMRYQILGKGYNYNTLNDWADTLKISLENNPRVEKVQVRENSYWDKNSSDEYVFTVDKELLVLNQITPIDLYAELKTTTLLQYHDLNLSIENQYISIRIESDKTKFFDLWHLENIPLNGLVMPLNLRGITSISKKREDENIYKENQEFTRLIEFQYKGSKKVGDEVLKENLDFINSETPLGFSFERHNKGPYLDINNNDNNYVYLLLLIIGIIYFICAILFESFMQPFIILSVIPIAFIGVFLTFYFFNFDFDQGGMASFVLLSGITVNASIFIVNGFNKLKNNYSNKSSIELYLEAFRQKILPIMLTVFSTILGFIPFVKGGQNEVFWFALGVGTIGGLLFSLIGILIYLPLFTLKKQ